MEKKLTPEEASNVRKQVQDNPLYVFVRDVILDTEEDYGSLAPQPEEVFIWVAHTIDSLLADKCPIERAKRLWNETCHSIRAISPHCDRTQMELLVGVEITIVMTCCFVTGSHSLTESIIKMQDTLDEHLGKDGSDNIRNKISEIWLDNPNLKGWIMNAYKEEAKVIGVLTIGENANTFVSQFRIAEGQKTNFAKVVKSMVDVGMFECDGKPLTTINKLIPQLGEFFGEDYKNLRQLFQKAKDSNTYIHIFDDMKNSASEYMNK